MYKPGPLLSAQKCRFVVWAPFAKHVDLIIEPNGERHPLALAHGGYWMGTIEDCPAGTRYRYSLDGADPLPDPASRFQPDGVHGPSAVVDSGFSWTDNSWKGIPMDSLILYELHVGTFTAGGTFDSAIERLGNLKDLGITAIELMPVAAFPGSRNWGYDGVFPYAPQNIYGGPDGLKRLVNACHLQGIAVFLDVVYNHLGPEGNYLSNFGPYFTDRYQTPWGQALNFDDSYSFAVRDFFIENALYWLDEFHFDGLRLDAVHAIYDQSATHLLEEMAERVKRRQESLGRTLHLIAESDLNAPRVIRPREAGGYGLHMQWSDDFHHAVHTLLTAETQGYYEDFGGIDQLKRVIQDGYVFTGQFSCHRHRCHGRATDGLSLSQFVVCIQNHDQIGNRMLGERLTHLTDFESCKLAAALLLLSPETPMLFMGEEFFADSPFLYFVDHSDSALIEAVRNGRKQEFSSFRWRGEPPDAQDPETFLRSKLGEPREPRQKAMRDLYKKLIDTRKNHPSFQNLSREEISSVPMGQLIAVIRAGKNGNSLFLANLAEESQEVSNSLWSQTRLNLQSLTRKLDTAATSWNGPGSQTPDVLTQQTGFWTIAPRSAVLFG